MTPQATVAATDRGQRRIYHIVDDEPAPYAVWIPYLAGALDGRPPFRVPTWLGLNWAPRFSWCEGFVHGLG
jgi:hypothetical protein